MSLQWTFYSFLPAELELLARDGPRCSALFQAFVDEERETRDRQAREYREREAAKYTGSIFKRWFKAPIGGYKPPPPEHRPVWSGYESVLEVVRVRGISYEGMSTTDCQCLDGFVKLCLLGEGYPIWETSDFQALSPEGIHPDTLAKLVTAARSEAEVPMLSLLKHGGRRIGNASSQDCWYCILSASEVAQALDETRRLLKVAGPWPEPYVPEAAKRELEEVFAKVVGTNRSLLCTLD